MTIIIHRGSMQFIRRYRIPAFFCAFRRTCLRTHCRPYAEMGIRDDWPYILMAQKLASTGHIVFNGWSAAMLGWQLYLGAGFIKALWLLLHYGSHEYPAPGCRRRWPFSCNAPWFRQTSASGMQRSEPLALVLSPLLSPALGFHLHERHPWSLRDRSLSCTAVCVRYGHARSGSDDWLAVLCYRNERHMRHISAACMA